MSRTGNAAFFGADTLLADPNDPEGMASVKMREEDFAGHIAPLSPQGPRENNPDEAPNKPPRIGRRTRAVFSYLWDANVSIFSLIRGATFLGPMMTGRYTRRRFAALDDEDLRTMHAYTHAIFTSKGSSEYALAHLLAPGAFARWAMVDRIATPVGGSAAARANIKVPVTFIYGGWDWMDVSAGRKACRILRAAGNERCNTFVVDDAGHHVYLDAPAEHDELLTRVLRGETDRPM